MIRRWKIEPDELYTAPDGTEILVVSRGALLEGIVDAAIMMDRAGGGFTVISGRAPSGMDGEMLTTGVVVEWRHHPNAGAAREEPKEVIPQPTAYEEPEQPEDDPEYVPPRSAPINDGIDESTLPEEDESAIEAHA